MPANDVTRLYSRVAGLYDTWTHFTESRSLDRALDEARIENGSSVLEVAVGTGVAFEKLLPRNRSGRNVGIDLTPAMLERARKKAERSGIAYELLTADARALPFADGSFDVVMVNNMLGVVPADMVRPILAETFRVLRRGGRLVAVMMKRPTRWTSDVVYRVGAVWLGGWRDVDLGPTIDDVGFAGRRRTSVTQLGIPSEIFVADRL